MYGDNRFDTLIDKKHGYRSRSILGVPILSLEGGGKGASWGVLQMSNKNRGTANFTEEDEGLLVACAEVFAYVAQRYPVDVGCHQFDANVLHKLTPFTAQPPQNMAVPVTRRSKRLVYRSTFSGHAVTKPTKPDSAVELGSSLESGQHNIIEVDAHIKSIEESWLNSVSLNVEYEAEASETLKRVRALRESLREKKKRIATLEAQIDTANQPEKECERCRASGGSVGESISGQKGGGGGVRRPPPGVRQSCKGRDQRESTIQGRRGVDRSFSLPKVV